MSTFKQYIVVSLEVVGKNSHDSETMREISV
jgi:hypothetical protein